MSNRNIASTIAAKAATFYPKQAPKCVEVTWDCEVCKVCEGSNGKTYRKDVKTFWRYRIEKLDDTLEAIPVLLELDNKNETLIMTIRCKIAPEDKTMLKDLGIELPVSRQKTKTI